MTTTARPPTVAPTRPATPAVLTPMAPLYGARYASRGMVASLSPEAAAAGLAVIQAGGNAFDAAIATALMEGIFLPGGCGLGGDMFAVLHDAKTGTVHAING